MTWPALDLGSYLKKECLSASLIISFLILTNREIHKFIGLGDVMVN